MSRRRAEDPEDFDGTRQRSNGRNGGPWWVKTLAWIGLPGFLVLFLLGAIPGLPSPLLGNQAQLTTLTEDLRRHEGATKAQLHLLRMICRGAWQGQPEIQRQCGARENSNE